MSTDPMTYIPVILHALDRLGATYRIVPARSEEINDLISWLERVFPLSHSQIDWTKVPTHRCLDWNDLEELVGGLQRLTQDLSASSLVVVTFGNALCPSLEMQLGDVNKVAREIFEQFETSEDIWIISREENWCIEMHHEGTLCRGKGRPEFVFLGVKQPT